MSEGKGCLSGSLTAATTFAGGDCLNLLNPEGAALLITRFILRVTTPSTGACTVDAGVAATGVSNDELLDGVDVNAAAAIFDNVEQCIDTAVAQACVEWGADEYLTVTPSASAAGLVATYYVEYVRA